MLQWVSMELMLWVIGPFIVLTLGLFLKTRFLNWKASIQIKMDTDYDLHNDFEFEGRHATMLTRNSQFVTIFFFDKRQTRKIGNREFIGTPIDINEPRREPWSKAKREAYRKFLKIDNGGYKSKEK